MNTSAPETTPIAAEPARQPLLTPNLRARTLTAVVLLPFGIVGALAGGLVWTLMMTPIVVIGSLEFFALAKGRAYQGNAWIGAPVGLLALAGFYWKQPALWIGAPLIGLAATWIWGVMLHNSPRRVLGQTLMTAIGIVYVGFPVSFLAIVRALPNGLLWLSVVLTGTWVTDTCAYFGGRLWGKRKLAPRISPKKTVEGAIIGVIGGFLLLLVVLLLGDQLNAKTLVMIALIPLVAVVGDLLESALKRFFDVKDSHLLGWDVVPGHGGVLDRVDSLLMVATFVYFFLQVTGVAR